MASLADCICANASLMGTTIGTRWCLLPNTINRVVGTGIELPSCGPTLGVDISPRWDIDFGVNTIRINFIHQVATYGMGAYFTFSNIYPLLPGCPPAVIESISVTTSKPTGTFNVAATTTFTDHSVVVHVAPPTANLDWQAGEFILIKLNFACPAPPVPVDPCCPPWNTTLLKDMMFYQGSGSINSPYTLNFQPTTAIKNLMQAYFNYIHLVNVAITNISIQFRLHDAGAGATPVTGAQIGVSYYVSWTPTTNGNPVVPSFFPGFPMVVNHWYCIHTGIYVEPSTQSFFPEKCANNDIFVRIQVLGLKAKDGVNANLEFSDGKTVIKTIAIK